MPLLAFAVLAKFSEKQNINLGFLDGGGTHHWWVVLTQKCKENVIWKCSLGFAVVKLFDVVPVDLSV